jgi:hypothetical protein
MADPRPAPMQLPDPIPGRACGACTACCTEMAVNDPELVKPANRVCIHLREGQGCAVHDRLNATCRHWYCGWRFLHLSDALRPDLSHVLLSPELGTAPGFQKGGLRLVLLDKDRAALGNAELVTFIARCVLGGVPIFLSWGEGDFAKRALVNDVALTAAQAGDRGGFIAALDDLLQGLITQVAMDVVTAQNSRRL